MMAAVWTDSDDERRFLEAAYKFIHHIINDSVTGQGRVGGDESSLSNVVEDSPNTVDSSVPHSRSHILSLEEWLSRENASAKIVNLAAFASRKSCYGSYRVAIIPYIPSSQRKGQDQGHYYKNVNKETILIPNRSQKAQSYRKYLPFYRASKVNESSFSDFDEFTTGSSSSSSSSQSLREFGLSSSTSDEDEFGKGGSFSSSNSSESSADEQFAMIEATYRADTLDDPELRTGKHRTVIKLTSYVSSIVQFTRADYLKQELNEKFRKLHPDLHPTMSLSKIRNLKSRLLKVADDCNLELSSVARSFAYLEKLILYKGGVCKENRKVVGACCLLLAAKATDSKSTKYGELLASLSKAFSIPQKSILDLEFTLLAALRFKLQLKEEQINGHLDRILRQLDYSNLQEYIGERMYNKWQGDTAN